MHTCASNSELVEPLPEPERTLNQRLLRRNRRVPFEQRNDPPQQPRVVYAPILDINYFRHFLVTLQNLNLMDDEPMWAADRVVTLTPYSTITIPEIANEFSIKGNHLTLVKGNQFDGRIKIDPHKYIHEFLRICDMFKYRNTENEVVRLMMFPYHSLEKKKHVGSIFLYKTPNQAYQLLEGKVLLKLDWAKNQKTKPSLKEIVAFTNEGSSNSDTEKIMARTDAMTMKMDAYDDKDEEPTPQSKIQKPKPVKETPIPKPYKPKIPYPQCLRKEKMEAQYGKFLYMILAIQINVPLIVVLARMPFYGNFPGIS
ncbi:hypothetical protein Tco_0448117 [Tanacetum coccineum]